MDETWGHFIYIWPSFLVDCHIFFSLMIVWAIIGHHCTSLMWHWKNWAMNWIWFLNLHSREGPLVFSSWSFQQRQESGKETAIFEGQQLPHFNIQPGNLIQHLLRKAGHYWCWHWPKVTFIVAYIPRLFAFPGHTTKKYLGLSYSATQCLSLFSVE